MAGKPFVMVNDRLMMMLMVNDSLMMMVMFNDRLITIIDWLWLMKG